ncbi:uncharacterized protein LOC121370988 [Gigantopelta aegis]|uniref:uncharacterized protein LOC121370988 n=1 Tax=Gigantopelta aegis TaxID=1735272 RepID=UPI001B88D748|nr:uncharacterized protein LOC121370988 [Gigantopelta aegis]
MRMNGHRGHLASPRNTVQALEYPELQVTGEPLSVPGISQTTYIHNLKDHDYESIGNVLARLETFKLSSSLPLTYIACECSRQCDAEADSGRLSTVTHDSDEDDSSDDDAVISIDHMLNVVSRIQNRPASASNANTVLRLISTYSSREDITVDQVSKIQTLVRTCKPEFREAGLLFMRQLFTNRENALLMAQMEVFNDLMTVLSSPHSAKIQTAALRAAEQLFVHVSVAELLCCEVEEVLLPVLLRILYSDHPMDMKYISCCILQILSTHAPTASLVGQELLFIVKELKNSNAKMKEVFVEIVINLYRQTDVIYPDMIDKNILQSATNMIRDGPCGVQQQALNLIKCLAEDESEISSVIKGRELVLCILQCLKDSHCRKVRSVASKVIHILTSVKKISLAKAMMEHFSALIYPGDGDSCGDVSARGTSKVVYPVRVKHKADIRMWNAFENTAASVAELICKEADIKEDESTGQLSMKDDQSVSDWNTHKLDTLSSLISIATNFCLWPVEKQKSAFNPPDLSDLFDDQHLRDVYSTLNRQVTLDIWNKCGRHAALILGKFAEKFEIRSNPLSARARSRSSSRHRHGSPVSARSCPGSPISARRGRTPRCDYLSLQEVLLIKNLLEFFLCIAISTCGRKGKEAGRLTKHEKEVTSSPKKNLWVMDNPHLTHSINRYSLYDTADAAERKQLELVEKETSTEQRVLRKGLYEEDLIRIVSPFIDHDDSQIRILSTKILRCAIQPLEEKLVTADNHNMAGASSGPVSAFRPRSRPGSAHCERERKMVIALRQMPSEVAGMIRDAIKVRPSSASGSTQSTQKGSAKKTTKINLKPNDVRPKIDLSKPIAHQCRQSTVAACGPQLIKGLFSKSRDVRKSSLLLMHDLVLHDNVETHMQLSELGCIPKLIDFIRINEEDEMLEIIALILTRLLVSSDHRLKQLFDRHGGSNMLMAMSMYTSGVIREEVKSTLKAITHGATPSRVRPSSAPAQRSCRPPDIWDKIMTRWGYEDKVVEILKKFA